MVGSGGGEGGGGVAEEPTTIRVVGDVGTHALWNFSHQSIPYGCCCNAKLHSKANHCVKAAQLELEKNCPHSNDLEKKCSFFCTKACTIDLEKNCSHSNEAVANNFPCETNVYEVTFEVGGH